MLNSFLVTLTDSQTAPVNPSAVSDALTWPAAFKPRVYTTEEKYFWTQFMGPAATALDRLLVAIQLLYVVRGSPWANYEFIDDGRVTYNDEQLLKQFTNQSMSPDTMTRCVSTVRNSPSQVEVLARLYPEVRQATSSLATSDVLGAIAAVLGRVRE